MCLLLALSILIITRVFVLSRAQREARLMIDDANDRYVNIFIKYANMKGITYQEKYLASQFDIEEKFWYFIFDLRKWKFNDFYPDLKIKLDKIITDTTPVIPSGGA
jgi:hypothetical protein